MLEKYIVGPYLGTVVQLLEIFPDMHMHTHTHTHSSQSSIIYEEEEINLARWKSRTGAPQCFSL